MVIKTDEGILDIYEGIKYPFNYSIGDVRDITKRNIDFSKTIKLPATKNNNKFFEFYFNVNVQSGSFNVNEREFITVEENGNVVFKGFLQLLSINVSQEGSYYEAVVFSSFRNILDIVEGLDLNDLDFSEYNHPYTYEARSESIKEPRRNHKYFDYKYIDENGDEQKVNNNELITIEDGYGYVYPQISYDGGGSLFSNNFPAFFVREYIDKIFLLAGFKVESKFFDTNYFKSLILPFSNGDLSLTSDEAERYMVSYTKDFHNYGLFNKDNVVQRVTLQFNDEIIDDSSQYNSSYNAIEVNKNGGKNIKIKGNIKFKYYPPANTKIYRKSTSEPFQPKINFQQYKSDTTVGGVYRASYPESAPMIGSNQQPIDFNELVNNEYDITFETDIENVYSEIGDFVRIDMEVTNNAYYYLNGSQKIYLEASITTTNTSFEYTLTEDSEILDGDILNMDKSISKLKITDFLKSIITMFNLYIYPKDGYDNTLIIETRDEFYNGNRTHFFDSKLDVSKGYKISTLSEESAKTYLYKYKTGDDYITKEYQQKNDGKTYAQKEVITNNQFLTNTQEYTVVFAATGSKVTTNEFGSSSSVPVLYDRELNENYLGDTTVINEETGEEEIVTDNNEYIFKQAKSSPRILFYDRVGRCSARNTTEYSTFTLDFEAMRYTETETWLPYFDLYNLFHKNTIEEVASPNAKLLTCYLNFNVSEIFIGDKIYVLGEYWRINKIIDYDANSNDSTKVELFKLKGNVNYLTAEQVIEQEEANTGLFNTKFNEKFS